MAENLEPAGIRLTAENAAKYTRDVESAQKATDAFNKAVASAARDISGGADFSQVASSLKGVIGEAGNLTGVLGRLSGAGATAGSGVAAGMTAAVAAIAGVIAIAGTAVVAVNAIGNAVQQAMSYSTAISRIGDVAGLGGASAQRINAGEQIAGVSGLANAFATLSDKAETASQRAEAGLAKVGAAADRTGTRLERLNEDYARSLADIAANQEERFRSINDNLIEAHTSMVDRLARLDETYARSSQESRQNLAERLADLDRNSAESRASLNDRLSRLNADYARDTLEQQSNLNQRLADLDSGLVEARQQTNDRLARLGEDYARNSLEAQTQLNQRLADLDARLVDSRTTTNDRLARLGEDYLRGTLDAQTQLNQRLADLAESGAQRVAAINGNLADEARDYARDREDIETRLSDRIRSLNERAADQSVDVAADGAKTQAKLQEDLQKELYSIEQRYSSQRQSLQEKIYDPNTNPILRAYYKTQVQSLKDQEKNEKDTARAIAGTKAEQARQETATALAAIQTRLAAERAIEQQDADLRESRRREDNALRVAELQAALAAELAAQQQQRDRLNADAAADAAERTRVYEQRIADLQAALAREEADTLAQRDRLQADADGRAAERQRVYDQQIADLQAALAAEEAAVAAQRERIIAGDDAQAAERRRVYEEQVADLQAALAREDAEHQRQSDRLRADQAEREADLRRSYDQQTADVQAAYTKQAEAAVKAQDEILKTTKKRLDDEKRQYDRALDDLTTSVGGGAAAATKAVDPLIEAFAELGINLDEFNKLTEEQKFKKLADTVSAFVASGDKDKAISALSKIMGREAAVSFVEGLEAAKKADQFLKDMGFTDEQIQQAKDAQQEINAVKLAVELFGNQIGSFFIPIVIEMIGKIREAYDWFRNNFLPAITDVYNFIKGNLETAFATLGGAANTLWNELEPVRSLIDSIANVAMAGLETQTRITSDLWNNTFLPAITDVGNFLSGTLGPALENVANFGLSILAGELDKARRGLDGIKWVIQEVANRFNDLANAVRNFRLPSVLTPGSPTPFELGLRGIADAMDQVNDTGLPALSLAPQAVRQLDLLAAPQWQMPETGAQMAARNTAAGGSSTQYNIPITVTIMGSADRGAVRDGVADGLARAGIPVVY